VTLLMYTREYLIALFFPAQRPYWFVSILPRNPILFLYPKKYRNGSRNEFFSICRPFSSLPAAPAPLPVAPVPLVTQLLFYQMVGLRKMDRRRTTTRCHGACYAPPPPCIAAPRGAGKMGQCCAACRGCHER